MFKEPTDNMLTVTQSIGNIGKEVKSIKKYQMKILELKQIVIKTKQSLNGLNNRLEMNEERISELKHESIEFIQSEEQR